MWLQYLARHQNTDGSWGRTTGRCDCRFAVGSGASEGEIRTLLSRLAEEDLDLRDDAQRRLEDIGTDAVPYLRSVARWGEPEPSSRCVAVLQRITEADVELTALGLLAFLAAGYTHDSRAGIVDGIEAGDVVRKAIQLPLRFRRRPRRP